MSFNTKDQILVVSVYLLDLISILLRTEHMSKKQKERNSFNDSLSPIPSTPIGIINSDNVSEVIHYQ